MNNMKTQAKLANLLAELGLVLADIHNLPLDPDCTGGVSALGEDEKLIGTVPEGITRVLYLVSRYYDQLCAEQKIVYEFAADGSRAELNAQTMGTLCKERADAYAFDALELWLNEQTNHVCGAAPKRRRRKRTPDAEAILLIDIGPLKRGNTEPGERARSPASDPSQSRQPGS